MTDCVNVTCFVLCYTDEVKAANSMLKVTLCGPLCLLACYTLHQRQSVDISTGGIIEVMIMLDYYNHFSFYCLM